MNKGFPLIVQKNSVSTCLIGKVYPMLQLCFHCFVVEMSTLTRENGTTRIKILAAEEVEGLIKEHEQVKAEEAKQAATKK